MNAPWWTNGARVVIELSDRRVPLEEIELFYWSWSDDPAESQRINDALQGMRQGAVTAPAE
jgi:hypothetical protein